MNVCAIRESFAKSVSLRCLADHFDTPSRVAGIEAEVNFLAELRVTSYEHPTTKRRVRLRRFLANGQKILAGRRGGGVWGYYAVALISE